MNTTGKLREAGLAGPELNEIILLDHLHFPNPWSEQQWRGLKPDQKLILSLRSPD